MQDRNDVCSVWLACEVQKIWLRDKQGWWWRAGRNCWASHPVGPAGRRQLQEPTLPSGKPWATNSQICLLCDLVVQSLGIYSK